MNKHYDVIIIGAGPGGLECAKQLDHTNLRVLIIEKNEIIGPKLCAGGLSALMNYFYIPEDKTRSFTKRIIAINNKQYTETLTSPVRTITRFDLGQYQLQQIKQSKNITILTSTRVIHIDENKISTSDKEEYYFKHLVGADGATSIVRKHLGLKSGHNIGFYFDIPVITNDFIMHFYPKQLKAGYVWVFPHQHYTNIGVCFNPKAVKAKVAKEILATYLSHNGYTVSDAVMQSSSINYLYQGCFFKNMYLVGDAAGLALKGTGEGISLAMISGKEIAHKILNPDYKTHEMNKFLRIKRKHEHLLVIFELFPPLQSLFFKSYFYLKKLRWFRANFVH